jgi:hypothetical protein
MKKLLLVLSVPALITSMQLPVAREPLSPRSREMAQQRAVINANRVEQQAFQEESTSAIIDLESDVWVLQRQVERLHAESATYTPQISAALGSANNQARLSSLHEQQIGTLERTQQLQAQLHAQHVMNLKTKLEKDNADLMQRIAAVEKSNYYLKWALGVSTAVTTTVFSIMGYLLWKNQQEQNNGNLITVSRDQKGKIIGFSQARAEAPYVAIPQPVSSESQPVQKATPQPAQSPQSAPAQTPATAQPLPQYATREQLQAVSERIDEVNRRIPQVARVMDRDGNIFLEYTDPGQQPRSGHSSYVGEFWPAKGFNERLK